MLVVWELCRCNHCAGTVPRITKSDMAKIFLSSHESEHQISDCRAKKESHNMGEQRSGSWPHESGQTSPMSSVATPPLPLGGYRNRRSKTGEKSLSSTRYLAVTWHHSTGRKKGHCNGRPVWSGKKQNAEADMCFGI